MLCKPFSFCSRCIQNSSCLRFTRLLASAASGVKQNHYEILGLNRDATQVQIRAAFVKLSKEIHPDKNPNDPHNHNKFVRLNEAYSILNKQSSRREYDVSLAHWLHMQQNLTRSGYSSHSTGFTSSPGTGPKPDSFEGDGQDRVFWDETIWHMRDRRKDANAFYPEDSYYGIRGLKRQSNGVVASACIVVILLGIGYLLLTFSYLSHKRDRHHEKTSRENNLILKKVREQARQNGIEKQLEILNEKVLEMERQKAIRKAKNDEK